MVETVLLLHPYQWLVNFSNLYNEENVQLGEYIQFYSPQWEVSIFLTYISQAILGTVFEHRGIFTLTEISTEFTTKYL